MVMAGWLCIILGIESETLYIYLSFLTVVGLFVVFLFRGLLATVDMY